MSEGAWLLLFWVVSLAAFLFVHVFALAGVLRSKELTRRQKLWSLIPVVTPWLAWRAGRRVAAVMWVALAVLYVALRAME